MRNNKRNTEWSRRARREKIVKENLAKVDYFYVPTQKAISKAYGEIHLLKHSYGELPGIDALEEVLKFLYTEKRFQSRMWYDLALQVALNRMKGRRFFNENEIPDIIKCKADVEQCIRELLRTAGIKSNTKSFVMSVVSIA